MIHRRFERLGKKLEKDKDTRDFLQSVPAVPPEVVVKTETIRGKAVRSKTAVKATFYDNFDGDEISVEALALQHYANPDSNPDHNPPWRGVHDEGAVLRTLFALSLWEAIFADVPGVFQTPFQRAPLDLCTDAFYQTRRETIDKLLVRVESASRSEERWFEILKPVWEEHFGCAVVGVQWELLTLAEMARVAAGVGGAVLAQVFRRLADDYGTWGGGLPDLLLWKPAQETAEGAEAGAAQPPPRSKLSEVKSQNDRLSERQDKWLQALTSFGAEAVVMHVLEKETEEEKSDRMEIAAGPAAAEISLSDDDEDEEGEDEDDFAE